MGASSSLPAADRVDTPLGFTLRVVEQILSDAADVSKEKGLKSFSSSLRAELFNINETLSELDESSYNDPMKDEILTVLSNLESLYQWPEVSETEERNPNEFTQDWYPGLTSLLLELTSARECIRKVATDISARKFRRQLFKSLASFGTLDQDFSNPAVFELAGKSAEFIDAPDNHSHLQKLHSAVSSFCICKCEQVFDGVITNLRLNWSCNERHEPDSRIPFGLLFLDHHTPSVHPDTCRWQDVRISIPTNRQRKVKFDEQMKIVEESHSQPLQKLGDIIRPMEKFCAFIARGIQAQLHFEVSEHGLEYQNAAQVPTSFLTNAESIPLLSLIKSRQLTAKMRALLSFFIARSVWQFYDSDWMKSWWSKDCVHFMGEHHRPHTDVVFINEPFLRTKVSDVAPVSTDNAQLHTFTTHLYPKILALGVMLLEIELGRPIQELSRPDAGDLSEVNALHWAACDILRDNTIWPPEDVFTDVREIIRICIEPDLEKLGLRSSQEVPGTEHQVRDQLYKSVVGVLQDFVQKAWGDPDKIKITPIDPRSPSKKEEVKKNLPPPGHGNSTFTNNDRIMTQIGSQHVAGDVHYHLGPSPC